jgi:hypothetical protein
MTQNCPVSVISRLSLVIGLSLLLATDAASAKSSPPGEKQTVQPEPLQRADQPLSARQRAWQILQEGLAEKSADKRANAVSALGLLSGNVKAEKAASEALKDDKFNVRAAAATALGSMHALGSIPELESALEDQEPSVVLAAANSLLLLKVDGSAYAVYYGVLTGTVRPSRGLVRNQMRTLHDPKKMAELGFEEGIGFVPFAGVGSTRPLSRTKSLTRRPSSSLRICWDTPDWVAFSRLAAAVKERSS